MSGDHLKWPWWWLASVFYEFGFSVNDHDCFLPTDVNRYGAIRLILSSSNRTSLWYLLSEAGLILFPPPPLATTTPSTTNKWLYLDLNYSTAALWWYEDDCVNISIRPFIIIIVSIIHVLPRGCSCKLIKFSLDFAAWTITRFRCR